MGNVIIKNILFLLSLGGRKRQKSLTAVIVKQTYRNVLGGFFLFHFLFCSQASYLFFQEDLSGKSRQETLITARHNQASKENAEVLTKSEIMEKKITHLKSQRDILKRMISLLQTEKNEYHHEAVQLREKIADLRIELDRLADVIEEIYGR